MKRNAREVGIFKTKPRLAALTAGQGGEELDLSKGETAVAEPMPARSSDFLQSQAAAAKIRELRRGSPWRRKHPQPD